MIQLAVGIPAYRAQIHVGVGRTLLQLGAAIAASRDEFHFRGFLDMDVCGVDKARNFLLAYAMKQGAEWLLMIDADTWVPDAAALLEMVRVGDREGAVIIGAPVFRRVDHLESLNVYRRNSQGRLETLSGWDLQKHSKPFPVDAIGSAIMAVDLRQISDAAFRFTDELSEDLDFCSQITKHRLLGASVWCDPRIKTYHAKSDVMIYSPPSRS